MKTLRELAEQYRSDVIQRIESLEAERDEYISCYYIDNDEETEQFDEQIAHWKATLEEINQVLNKNYNR